MIYRVFHNMWAPSICPDHSIAGKVIKDHYDTTGTPSSVEKDEELSLLRLDFGGCIWKGAEEIQIQLPEENSVQPAPFTFYAHQLVRVYDQVRTNWFLVEETGYVKFYGNLFNICMSPNQAAALWKHLSYNFDMYKIIEDSCRKSWNDVAEILSQEHVGVKTAEQSEDNVFSQTDNIWNWGSGTSAIVQNAERFEVN